MAARMRALDMPEIKHHIAQFLARPALVVCVRVCRDWNQAFLPFLWRELSVRTNPVYLTTGPTISFVTLAQHAESVKSIKCSEPNSPFQALTFPALTDLSLHQVNASTYFDFIHRHSQTLVHLQFDTVGSIWTDQESDALWEIIASCSSLKSLSVVRVQITQKSWQKWCWPAWARLTTLRLRDVSIRDVDDPDQRRNSPVIEKELMPTTIRHLELLLDNSFCLDQLALLKWCPELESLVWFPRQTTSHNVDELFVAQARHCPKLNSVYIATGFNYCKNVDPLFPFLQEKAARGLSPLKKLEAGGHWIGNGSSKMLLSHYASTLQSLDLYYVPNVESSMVQDFLCSLPLLESFSARYLFEDDVVEDPRPWVCLRLVKFHVVIWLGPTQQQSPSSSRETQMTVSTLATSDEVTHPSPTFPSTSDVLASGSEDRGIYERLGTLLRIQHFDLEERVNFDPGNSHRQRKYGRARKLQLGLKNGLDRLKGWRDLRVLGLVGTEQKLTGEDALWMKENWPRLEAIRGRLNSVQSDTDNACREILKDVSTFLRNPGPSDVFLV